MSLPALIVLLASLTTQPSTTVQGAAVKVTVDAADGASISGERNFKVLVSTDDIVTKVEMYVGSEKRAEESSTPYRFTIDTINEKDGPVDFKWVAYTDQSHKGTVTVHLKIDNGMALGVDSHVQTGNKLLQDGNAADAITQGRIALKIDKKSDSARFLLARAYMQMGVFDKAQKYVQDVTDDEPKNLEALDLTSAISLKQAFSLISKNDQNMEALTTIGNAFKTAVTTRRALVDAHFDTTPAPKDDASTMVYVAAAIGALRFSDAINVLDPMFKKAASRADIADRLAYCQMRDGRMKEAVDTMHTLKVVGRSNSDPYAQALTGLLLAYAGDSEGSKAAMEDAELNDSSNVGVQTAQASVALHKFDANSTQTLRAIATSLGKDQGQRTEVNYLLASLYNRLGNYIPERKFFEDSVLADPLNYDMFIEEGCAAILFENRSPHKDKTDKARTDFDYAYAELMFQTALEAKSDSYQALTGLSLINGILLKPNESLKFAQAAVLAQPDSACAQEALSAAAHNAGRAVRPTSLPSDDTAKVAYDLAVKHANELDQLGVDAMAKAGKLDPSGAGGRSIPSTQDAFVYFARNGRSPVISKPG